MLICEPLAKKKKTAVNGVLLVYYFPQMFWLFFYGRRMVWVVSTQNKLQYVCVCVYVRDNEGICHPNPVWLTDVFLIVFG